MKTCCPEVNSNLESPSNCNFLNKIFLYFLILLIILVNNLYKTKKNKINNFDFVLCYEIIIIVYFCVKNEKVPFYCISWKLYTWQTDRKVANI